MSGKARHPFFIIGKELLGDMNLTDCTLCPRECHADRTAGQIGFCGQTDELMVARAALHKWEEPCISGTNGSGAVFLCGCNLRCIFCQNYTIAHRNSRSSHSAKVISTARLAEIFLELQDQSAHNINLVTPSHYVPQIIEALELSKSHGLHLPIVYNTGSYEKVETLKQLDGYIDIYLPDLKYYSSALSNRFSNAPDYFTYASAAIAEMYRQVGAPEFDVSDVLSNKNSSGGIETSVDTAMDISETALMKRGVLVRHLLLPGCGKDSRNILQYLHQTYGNNIYMSIMNQYTPMPQASTIPSLNRNVTEREYDSLIDYAISLGIENAFIQEGATASASLIPSFNGEGV